MFNKSFIMNRKRKTLLWISGAATLAICAVMNLWLIPAIEGGYLIDQTQGVRCFDMQSLGYSVETANRFLAQLTEEGRDLYLHVQLPLDFFYPVAYGTFFTLLICALKKKISPLATIPLLLMLFDYAENICSIVMLRRMTATKALAGFASTMTVTKSLLLTATALVCIVLLASSAVKRIHSGKLSEKQT